MSTSDARLDALTQWLVPQIAQIRSIAPASADASFRRYFRITDGTGNTTIAMDAPPPQEDCRPFVAIAQMMAQAGVYAPRVIAQDVERGFLLLTDLGNQTFLEAFTPDNAKGFFADARAALIKWQLSSRPDVLPAYDEALLKRELALFPDWYVGKHLKKQFTPTQQTQWDHTCKVLLQRALAQPKVFVHRDYMPRNLMVSTPNPGVLDFQDAVYGPIAYDVISLYRDAFVSWDEEFVLDGIIRYWEAAKKAGLPVPEEFGEFYHDCEWMGLQRHLKVMGIFARINYRDGKPKYLADTPRFEAYVRSVAQRYEALAPLSSLFDSLHDAAAPQFGYTF